MTDPSTLSTRTLGRTGLEVTVVGYGAMELRGTGGRNPRPLPSGEAGRVLGAVLDAGINFIDTSIDYGDSERLIGESIAHRRDEYWLASKAGCHWDGGSLPHDFSPGHIRAGLEREHETVIAQASEQNAGVIIRGGVAKGGPRPDRPRNVWEAWESAGLDELLDPGQSRVEFVLRFTLAHPGLSTIIVGTASVDHLTGNVANALRGPLPGDVYREAQRRLDAAGVSPLRR